jgi:hypothetical protein
MNLAQLQALVANANIMAEAKGIPAEDYPVYMIGPRGVIHDINSWSPADWNRGGVAFIAKGTWAATRAAKGAAQ